MSSVFRSGSALLSRMINAHPLISVTDDKLKYFLFTFEKNTILNKTTLKNKLKEIEHRLNNRWGIIVDIDRCFDHIILDGITYGNLHKVLTESISANNSKVKGEMESLSWRNIEHFFDMHPEGKSIMIVRDLRDVLCSFKKNTIAQGNDYLIALFNVIDSMDHYFKYTVKYPKKFLGIRYEELKENPDLEAKKICTFLGVEYDCCMLNSDNWTDDLGGKWGNTNVSSFYNVGDHKNPVGRWKKLITEEDLFLCEWLGREQIKKFNMKPEDQEISQETFDKAINKLQSSKLLRAAFKNWTITGSGVQKYPTDPVNPKNWDQREILNVDEFNI